MHWKQLKNTSPQWTNDEQTANTFPCTSFGLYNVINDALLQIQASRATQYAKIQKFSLIYKR